MARTDYGAILSTVIKDTSDAIREVNDTSALIAPNNWGTQIRTMHSDADYENALSYIPTKTVSGAIASFNDGAGGLNLKSLKVAITAKQSGSGTPAPDNPRPIIGVSECNVVNGSSINIWDEQWEQGGYGSTGEKTTASVIRNKNLIPVRPNTTYYFYRGFAVGVVRRVFWDENMNCIYSRTELSVNTTFTTPNNAVWFGFNTDTNYGTTYRNDISINNPPSETGYYAHTGGAYTDNTYTIQLGDTYYGGELDVTTGVLTVDRKFKDFDGTENWVNVGGQYPYAFQLDTYIPNIKSSPIPSQNIICNMFKQANVEVPTGDAIRWQVNTQTGRLYVYCHRYSGDLAGFKAMLAENNLQVCYVIATPIIVQLTPTQIEQLLGGNNIFADTGVINECIYYSTASGVQSIEGSYQRADATGVSSVPYLIYTYTATEDCTMCFCGTIATDTSQSQGFLKMVVNDSDDYRTAGLVQYNETPFSLDNISLQSGDTVKFYGDWEDSHSGCFFHLRLSMVKAV